MRSMIAVKREMARLAKRTDGDQSEGWKREESLRLWALLWATGWSEGDCDDFIQNARAPMNAEDSDMDDWQPSKHDEAHAAACEGYPDTCSSGAEARPANLEESETATASDPLAGERQLRAEPLFCISRFRSALVRHGVIASAAIADPEGYDGGLLLAATREAYKDVMESARLDRQEEAT